MKFQELNDLLKNGDLSSPVYGYATLIFRSGFPESDTKTVVESLDSSVLNKTRDDCIKMLKEALGVRIDPNKANQHPEHGKVLEKFFHCDFTKVLVNPELVRYACIYTLYKYKDPLLRNNPLWDTTPEVFRDLIQDFIDKVTAHKFKSKILNKIWIERMTRIPESNKIYIKQVSGEDAWNK